MQSTAGNHLWRRCGPDAMRDADPSAMLFAGPASGELPAKHCHPMRRQRQRLRQAARGTVSIAKKTESRGGSRQIPEAETAAKGDADESGKPAGSANRMVRRSARLGWALASLNRGIHRQKKSPPKRGF